MNRVNNKEKYKEYDHNYYIKHKRPKSKIGQAELKIADLEAKLAEKDKEIERLKNLFKLNNEVVINQGKEIFDLRVQVLQQNQNQTQLAIQELEKVNEYADEDFRKHCYIDAVQLEKFINQQIKELKGQHND